MEMKVYQGYFAFHGAKIKYLEFRMINFLNILESTIKRGINLVYNKNLKNISLLDMRAKPCCALFIIDMKMLLWWPFHNFYGRYLK